MSKTLFNKIWDNHVVKQVTNEMDVLYIDRHFIHEVTSPQAFKAINDRGLKVFRPEKTLATADHNVPTQNQHLAIQDELSRTQVEMLTKNCNEHGIELFGIGHPNQGIVHVIGPELGYTRPGMTIVCGDSHTSTHGAFGNISFGIGTSQIEQVFASQCLLLKRPKTMKIQVNGVLPRGTSAKDLILYIIAELGTEGATEHFVEFCGEAISSLSMEQRMTICNMSIEMGARGGMVGIDATTLNYLQHRVNMSGTDWEQAKTEWLSLNTDPNATYDKTLTFEAKDIGPMVTCGTAPDTGIKIDAPISSSKRISDKALAYMGFKKEEILLGKNVDYIFIGSCTNSRIEDLRAAAGLIGNRKKAKNVNAWIVPGSQAVSRQAIAEGLDQIFIKAGFEFRQPGCSACLAMNEDKVPSGALCISTSNRNFEGRQGEGARTILASPETAIASALSGKIENPAIYLS